MAVLAVALLGVVIGAGAVAFGLTPLSPPPPTAESVPPATVVIPVYNNRGVSAVRDFLRPYLRRGDTFMIVSGNQDGEYDPVWVDMVAETLRTYYPGTRIVAATSGMANIELAIEATQPPVEGLVYIYEPDFANEPEFSWEEATAERLFDVFSDRARGAGFRAIGKPTGRALVEPARGQYLWNYESLGARVDDLFVQTQLYCEAGVESFRTAMETLMTQFGAGSATDRWLPQITVDIGSTSGVAADRALACAEAARQLGVNRFLMWWSPAFVTEAVDFLEGLRG